jgi:hypothetical protein
MLLKYFSSNRLSVIVVIWFIPVICWIPSLIWPAGLQAPEVIGIPPERLLFAFNEHFRLLSSISALALVVFNGYLLIQLNIIHVFIPRHTQLPALFYLILVVGIGQLQQLTPALVSSTLLILVFYRIFNAYKAEGASMNFLDAGFLISLAGMFYFQALGFFLLLLAAMLVLRPFNWREWTYAWIGLIIPCLFLCSAYYLADIPLKAYFGDISGSLVKKHVQFNLSEIISWSYSGIVILICSYDMIENSRNMKIQTRKFFRIFLLYFLFSGLIYLLVPGTGKGIVYYLSVPLAYLFTFYFTKSKRNWFHELLFILFLLLLLWQMIS